MKQLVFNIGLATALATASVSAQDVVVDDFESYVDDASVDAVWKSIAGNGAETVKYRDTGGANGTDKWGWLFDTGYTAGVNAADILPSVTPGTYKLSFYWQNGVEGGNRWRGLKVSVVQGGSPVQVIELDPGAHLEPKITTWQFAETAAFALTGDPVSIRVDSTAGNGALTDYYAAIDEIKLVPIVAPALQVSPPAHTYLSGIEQIVATPAGGTGTYTSVTFDVGNDNSVESTANAAPYTFSWDTLASVPADTSGTVALKVTVTDSNNEQASVIHNYVIDNTNGGREIVISNDFSSFQGTGFGDNIPTGWVLNDPAFTNATYGPGEDRNANPDQALSIAYSTTGYSNRYLLRAEGVQGALHDLQTSYWGKGGSNRVYYLVSTDNEATYVVQDGTHAAQVNNAAGWVFDVGPVQNFGLTASDFITVATHMFLAETGSWDDIVVKANEADDSSVAEWQFY